MKPVRSLHRNFSRYPSHEVSDPYLVPGTDALRNRLGITDVDVLKQEEDAYTALRLVEFEQGPSSGTYDLKNLQTIHQCIFQDVYDWAGELRTTHILKYEFENAGRISRFTAPERIVEVGNSILERLKNPADLRNLTLPDMANHLGEICTKLNTLHPFREGNGRASRAFLSKFVQDVGQDLNFEGISRERWIRASINAHFGDPSSLVRVFAEILDPEARRRFHAIKPKFDAMRRDNVWDWHEHYISVPPPGRTVDGIVAIATEEIVVVRTRDIRFELIRPASIRYVPKTKDHIVMIESERAWEKP